MLLSRLETVVGAPFNAPCHKAPLGEHTKEPLQSLEASVLGHGIMARGADRIDPTHFQQLWTFESRTLE